MLCNRVPKTPLTGLHTPSESEVSVIPSSPQSGLLGSGPPERVFQRGAGQGAGGGEGDWSGGCGPEVLGTPPCFISLQAQSSLMQIFKKY